MIPAFLVCVAVAIGYLVMGIAIRKSDKPAGYYTFVKKPEVDDVKKYNNEVSVLWYIAAGLMVGNAVPLLFLEKDSPELVAVSIVFLFWVIVLVFAYRIIEYVRSVNIRKRRRKRRFRRIRL